MAYFFTIETSSHQHIKKSPVSDLTWITPVQVPCISSPQCGVENVRYSRFPGAIIYAEAMNGIEGGIFHQEWHPSRTMILALQPASFFCGTAKMQRDAKDIIQMHVHDPFSKPNLVIIICPHIFIDTEQTENVTYQCVIKSPGPGLTWIAPHKDRAFPVRSAGLKASVTKSNVPRGDELCRSRKRYRSGLSVSVQSFLHIPRSYSNIFSQGENNKHVVSWKSIPTV